MRLSSVTLIALGLALLGTGCASSTNPMTRQVTGYVRYTNGTTSSNSQVTASGGASTRTDASGHYTIRVPATSVPITLTARDGYGAQVTAGQNVGTIRVVVPPGGLQQDIVLDHFEPI